MAVPKSRDFLSDDRVLTTTRVTSDYYRIILREGLWIPPQNSVYGDFRCRVGVTGTVSELKDALKNRVTFCYCDTCRELVVKQVLELGELPSHLVGWKP